MPPRKNRGEQLLNHLILSDDDLLQFLLHQLPMLSEFLQYLAKRTLLFLLSQDELPCGENATPLHSVLIFRQ